MKSLFSSPTIPSNFDQLVYDFEKSKIAEVEHNDSLLREKGIREAAKNLLRFEIETRIDSARKLLGEETVIKDRLSEFKKLEAFYSRSESEERLIEYLVSGDVLPGNLSDELKQIDLYSAELRVTKTVVEKLEASLEHVQGQLKLLPAQALTDAKKPDPIAHGDRQEFSRGL